MLCEARCQRRQTTNLIDTKRGVGFKEFFCLTPFTQGLRYVPFLGGFKHLRLRASND